MYVSLDQIVLYKTKLSRNLLLSQESGGGGQDWTRTGLAASLSSFHSAIARQCIGTRACQLCWTALYILLRFCVEFQRTWVKSAPEKSKVEKGLLSFVKISLPMLIDKMSGQIFQGFSTFCQSTSTQFYKSFKQNPTPGWGPIEY